MTENDCSTDMKPLSKASKLSPRKRWLQILGPGIMFASACIGVSHLVQSTRAGAVAGFGLLWAILAANAAKYPFFEFGSRYASAKGESLIEGYRTIGSHASRIYLALTLGTCFFVMAAVGMVTGAFLDNLLGVSSRMGGAWTTEVTSGLFVGCTALLLLGKFNALDKLVKLLASVLLVSTVVAVVLTVTSPQVQPSLNTPSFDWTSSVGFAFVIALMGWMPSAVDLSTWNSFWTLERIQTTGYKPTLQETLAEFNWGFGISVVLALGFLTMGAMLLHQTSTDLPNGSAAFAAGIVGLYAKAIGPWSAPIMGAAAFSAMFSTCVTVLDGYARSLDRAWAVATGRERSAVNQRLALVVVAGGALGIVLAFQGQLKTLVDLATTLSFVIAPVIAWWNLKLVTNDSFPAQARPGSLLKVWAWGGLVFLSVFSMVYLWTLIAP